MPATMARDHTGALKISTSTIGISTTAVAMRLSKGIVSTGTRNYNQMRALKGFYFVYFRSSSGLRFDFFRRVRVVMVKSAIPPLALLILGNSFEQVYAAKIRPKGGRDIDFR